MKKNKHIISGSLILAAILVQAFPSSVCAENPNVFNNLPVNLRNAIGKVNPFKKEKTGTGELNVSTAGDVRNMLADILPYLEDPFVPKIPEEKVQGIGNLNIPTSSGPIIGEDGQEILPPAYKIGGMVWNSERPQAIVDGTILSVGDQIGGWTISSISKNGVEFSDVNGASFTLEP